MGRIVVGVDGSAVADRALRWAVDEAALRGDEIELVLCYGFEAYRAPSTTPSQEIADQAMDAIANRNSAVLQRVQWKTTVVPLFTSPAADGVLSAAEAADLIVVGSRGFGGFRELLLGSTSNRVATHAEVPVVVVRGDQPSYADAYRGIVVGIDGSRAAVRALRWAVAEAALRGIDVTALHGWHGWSAPDAALLSGMATAEQIDAEHARAEAHANAVLQGAMEAVPVPEGTTVSPLLVAATPAAAILDNTDSDQLLVVGTRGFGGLRRAIVGSTTHQVLHHAPGPVVVVP